MMLLSFVDELLVLLPERGVLALDEELLPDFLWLVVSVSEVLELRAFIELETSSTVCDWSVSL